MMDIADYGRAFFEKKNCSKWLRMAQFAKKKGYKPKFENFAFPLGPRVPDFVIFWRFWKFKSWCIFSTLAGWICLIMHIMIVLIVLRDLTATTYLDRWHNYAKLDRICFKNVLICKDVEILNFDHLLDFILNMLFTDQLCLMLQIRVIWVHFMLACFSWFCVLH